MKFLEIIDGVTVSAFAGPQNAIDFPGLIEVSDDDPRYLALIAAIEPEKVVLVPSTLERQWRDLELASVMWLRERHRDQLEIGTATTLTGEQFKELLVYMQSLRNWPQSPDFPQTEHRPVAPSWIAEQTQ